MVMPRVIPLKPAVPLKPIVPLEERVINKLVSNLTPTFLELITRASRTNELLAQQSILFNQLIATIKASPKHLSDSQVELIAQKLEIALARPPIHPELPPYNIRKFLLDTARAEPGVEVQVPGNVITAYTNSDDLVDIYIRIDSPVSDAIPLNEFNPYRHPRAFDRFWLETPVKSGKYLRLYIGRGEAILADTVKVGQRVRESFTHRPVSGDLTSDGIQYSSGVVSVAADTDYYEDLGTYEPERSGKIDGKATGGVVEFSFTIGLDASGGTPNAKYKIQARNKGGTWVDLFAIQTEAISVTEEFHTWSGYFTTVANFNAVPFDLRLVIQSNSATNTATGRVKNSSYVRGEFEPGT